MAYDKLVVVTRRTRLDDLIARFNTHGQARFYLTRSGDDFDAYQREHDAYRRSLEVLSRSLELGLKTQWIDRSFLPTFVFTPHDLVLTVGQDGLVANAAKYVGAQPIVAVNPDPERFDGVLLPFAPDAAANAVRAVITGSARMRKVTLGEVRLGDGQRLLAFNDFYLGAQTHVSARYRIAIGSAAEEQSSSGVLVSTGAGATGWLSSVFNMTRGVADTFGADTAARVTAPSLAWEDPRLVYIVREPFASRHSRAGVVAGTIDAGTELRVESRMPSGGVIFSDGVEADFLGFNAGAVATVRAAEQQAMLVAAEVALQRRR
jgi:hypothetical protein